MNEKTYNFEVGPEEALTRLDVFLTGRLPDITRSGIKRLIEDGRVLLNGAPGKAGHKLKSPDSVRVSIPGRAALGAKGEAIPLEILYEDADIIVVNKQSDLAVHPGAGRPSGTLVNAILNHTPELSTLGGSERPGIVHRLDKDTTGALVVAKNDSSYISLARQFKEHSIGRAYLALVWGAMKADEGEIDLAIGRDLKHRKKISPKTRKSRTALTHYRVKRRYPYLTLVELFPKTGRTHQLRVHLASINHPVVGDQTYGRKKMPSNLPVEVTEALRKIKRQLLHAEILRIVHPSKGVEMEFVAPVPADMQKTIEKIEALALG